jgi:hypothetical protein
VAHHGRRNADEALALAVATGQTLRDAKTAGLSKRSAVRRWAKAASRRRRFPCLQRALRLAKHADFGSEDMVKLLNPIRPSGDPEVEEAAVLSVAGYADALEGTSRECVQWWGG